MSRNMNNSRISVCLPNYNHGRYLAGAVEALMAQSHRPHEIIIVDDTSTDDSVQIIEELCSKYPSIIFLRNDVNQGCCRSTNRAISVATGNFIFNTAADDLVLAGYFEKAVAGLLEHPEAGVCVTQVKFIDEAGRDVQQGNWFWQFYRGRDAVGPGTEFLRPSDVLARIRRNPWFIYGGPSPLFRRETIIAAGGLREELGAYTDWFNVHFAALRDGMVCVPEPLVAFRVVAGGFGEAAARDPILASRRLARVLDLMRDPKFKHIFPPDFISRKEIEFVYYAFAGSLNVAHRSFCWGINQVIPASSLIDRVTLGLLNGLHALFKAVLLWYCRRKRAVIHWPR